MNFKNQLIINRSERAKYFIQLLNSDVLVNPNRLPLNSNIQHLDQQKIIELIKRFHDEKTFIQSIDLLAEIAYVNADQALHFLTYDDFQYLLKGMHNPQTTRASMIILYYAIQNDSRLQSFFTFIEENESSFFYAIKGILNYANVEDTLIISILFLHSLSKLNEVPPLLIKYEIFRVINKLANKSEDVDFCISFYYSFVSKLSFGDFTQDFFDSIFPLLYCFCQHKNPEIIPHALETLRYLMQNSILPYHAIMQSSMINIFVKYIGFIDYPSIQESSIRILNSCIQYQDFPLNLIFDLDIIENIFFAIQSNDPVIVDACVSFFKSIFQKDKIYLPKIVNRCEKFEFLNYFSLQPFEIKVKVVDLFNTLLQYSTSSNANFFCSEKNIEFIINLMFSADDNFHVVEEASNALNFLVSRYHANQNFVSYLLYLVKDSECVEYLIHSMDEMEMKPECANSVFSFIQNINLLEQSLNDTSEM